MAKQPWVTPEELKEYTSFEDVKKCSDIKLRVMIQRATNRIINYTHNSFCYSENDSEKEVPDAIKNIAILVAEALSHNEHIVTMKRIKSETYDDYAYTAEYQEISIDDILADIPEMYLKSSNGTISFEMFKL